jgi:glutathione S-transferase
MLWQYPSEYTKMLTLFYFPPACSIVSHIALEEAGLPYEAILARPGEPAERQRLLAINPRGTVPTLLVNGRALTENVAIATFISDQTPQAALLPSDSFDRAKHLSFLAWCASTVHVAFRQSFRPERFSPDPQAHDAIRQHGRQTFLQCLAKIDAEAQRCSWTMGERFSLCDGYVLAFHRWAIMTEATSDLPHFCALAARIAARPAVQRVLQAEHQAVHPDQSAIPAPNRTGS